MAAEVQLQDEYFLDTPAMRKFIADVRGAIAGGGDVEAMCDALQPYFTKLLADPSWLSDEFASPYAASGMGGGIGTWRLFRAGDRSLRVFGRLPPGQLAHDHVVLLSPRQAERSTGGLVLGRQIEERRQRGAALDNAGGNKLRDRK